MIGVCIVTYNQEQYIGQAIESVLTQEDCGHEVVIYVGEDNSTDRTGKICDEIANRVNSIYNQKIIKKNTENHFMRIKVIHNEKNLGLVGNTMNLLDIMWKDGCEFIAMLDGDDYWCDAKKLQKQMAYMEAHPEIGLVHTYGYNLWGDKLEQDDRINVPEGDVFQYIGDFHIGNCTVVFRTELLNLIDFEEFQNQGLGSCDYSMYAIFASKTKFGFMYEHTAVWRRGIESVSGTADMEKQIRYVKNDLAHWRYLAKLFPERWHCSEQEAEDYMHMYAFNTAFRYGDRKRALKEVPYLSKKDKREFRLKIFIAHSAVLMALWGWGKKMKG